MDKNKNPYIKIINIMQDQGSVLNPSSVELGKVISVNPLAVTAGDLPLFKENLLVADYLLGNYSRKINLPSTTATGNTTDGNIQSISIPDATLNFTDTLKEGDILGIVQVTASKYIILCRVVEA